MNKLQAAAAWLCKGAELLPIQPRSKRLVQGYGLHQARISSLEDVGVWWGNGSNYNLAILTPPGMLALDFDDEEIYYHWLESIPPQYCLTYQETSPRGWHVFYKCQVPEGLSLIPGAEIKRIILVSPSELSSPKQFKFVYQPIGNNLPLVQVHDYKTILSFLLSDPKPKSFAVQIGTDDLSKKEYPPSKLDLVTHIKKRFSIFDLASRFTELSRSGHEKRWLRGKCPLPGHKDDNPSFWVDIQRGLWGCYACQVRGDVINLYARMNNLTVQEAIRELSQLVSEGSAV